MKIIIQPVIRDFLSGWIMAISMSFFAVTAFGQRQNGLVFLPQVVIQTDQQEYPPGSNVYIAGSSWLPGEHVMLQVLHLVDSLNELPSPAHAHFPWTAIADSSGNLRSSWHIPLNENEPNAALVLKATGLLSGRQTIWIFHGIPVVPYRRRIRIRH